VLVCTEAGAKGLNLQFCETVINYDLPWNPQRIEQRIGRCHRYSQQRDVTVVNFIARDNEAHSLTFEILSQKLDLFALYILRPGHEARLSSATGGRLMLMGGQAFATRRYVFWNFVSSSRDRINQAKDDWKALRFALIPGDDQEYIPLPEVPLTVSYP